jgi:hypothetical protein
LAHQRERPSLPPAVWHFTTTCGGAGAFEVMQQSQAATYHTTPLLNQNAVRALLLTSSLSSALLVSLGHSLVWSGHSVGEPLAVCERKRPGASSAAAGGHSRSPVPTAHPVRASGQPLLGTSGQAPPRCQPPYCRSAFSIMPPPPYLVYTLGQLLPGSAVAPRCQRCPGRRWVRHCSVCLYGWLPPTPPSPQATM